MLHNRREDAYMLHYLLIEAQMLHFLDLGFESWRTDYLRRVFQSGRTGALGARIE